MLKYLLATFFYSELFAIKGDFLIKFSKISIFFFFEKFYETKKRKGRGRNLSGMIKVLRIRETNMLSIQIHLKIFETI